MERKKLIKQISDLLVSRKIECNAEYFALHYSSNKVHSINELTIDSLSKLLKTLKDFTSATLHLGIYQIAKELGWTDGELATEGNDFKIIEGFKSLNLISPDGLFTIINYPGKADFIIYPPLAYMPWIVLYVMSVEIGNVYMKRLELLN